MTSARLLRIGATALAVLVGACSSDNSAPLNATGTGGSGSGGSSPTTQPSTGGKSGSGGAAGQPGSGGSSGSGGGAVTGGTTGSGGRTSIQASTGGTQGTGGTIGSGGAIGSGGQTGNGGATGMGGSVGRDAGRDLPGATAGRTGTGGASDAGGNTSTATSTSTSTAVDCTAAMPTGGQQHSGNSRGGSGNLAWEIWSNQGSGTLTTFSTPAFTAAWNNSGDYLGRLGFEWGTGGKTYDQYGTIAADYAYKKTGSAGGYSYIGIYGWSTNPCTEWYIVDDSFGAMPFNPYSSSQKGTATIDGETYKLFSNSTNGTGGSRCNASSWTQHWSVRQKGRQCGTITLSDHFKAWDAAGMKLGTMLEAKILVETGGGSGNVEFAIAKMTTSK